VAPQPLTPQLSPRPLTPSLERPGCILIRLKIFVVAGTLRRTVFINHQGYFIINGITKDCGRGYRPISHVKSPFLSDNDYNITIIQLEIQTR
jgi:hypothetical protein